MVLARSLLSRYCENMPAMGREYYHVYNKGVDNRLLFKDEEDYKIFLDYLASYLSSPVNPKSAKKTFVVRGRTFSGTPHQPKNYFTKIELLAYSLSPDRFHLLLVPNSSISLQGFIRSLCTRYSLYYNKKYKRTGSLFEGPYKSLQLRNFSDLMLLTRFFHLNKGQHSSYPVYLGKSVASWVNKNAILSIKKLEDYRDYVENRELNQIEKTNLAKIILEKMPLERSHVESTTLPEARPDTILVPNQNNQPTSLKTKPVTRFPEFIGAAVVFVILTSLSIKHISSYQAKIAKAEQNIIKIAQHDSNSEVLSESVLSTPIPNESITTKTTATPPSATEITSDTSTPTSSANPEELIKVIITVPAGSTTVNVHDLPEETSQIIYSAKDGDTFDYITDTTTGWYEIKLPDGKFGFVMTQYATK